MVILTNSFGLEWTEARKILENSEKCRLDWPLNSSSFSSSSFYFQPRSFYLLLPLLYDLIYIIHLPHILHHLQPLRFLHPLHLLDLLDLFHPCQLLHLLIFVLTTAVSKNTSQPFEHYIPLKRISDWGLDTKI